MRRWLFLLLLFGLFTQAKQSLAQTQGLWWVISSSGQFLQPSANGPSLHYTIGEIMVEQFDNGVQLTQGYHQVLYWVTPVDEVLQPDWQVDVFPNPTSGYLTVRAAKTLQGRLFDLTGQELMQVDLADRETQLDLSGFPSGTYLLQLKDPTAKATRTFKVQIIQ